MLAMTDEDFLIAANVQKRAKMKFCGYTMTKFSEGRDFETMRRLENHKRFMRLRDGDTQASKRNRMVINQALDLECGG